MKLSNPFKKKKTYPASEKGFDVLIINDESNEIGETLGISKERFDELIKMTAHAYRNHATITDTFVEIAKNCKHVNELVYMAYVVNDMNTKRNGPDMGDLLAKFLSRKREE
jgi:hypothetical protein